MTNRNIINPLKNVDTGRDGAHSVKVIEHMKLNIPQAIMLILTAQKSTTALIQLHLKFLYSTKSDNTNILVQIVKNVLMLRTTTSAQTESKENLLDFL